MRMFPRFAAALLLLALPARAQETKAPSPVKVEAVGLHVNKAPHQGDPELAPNMEPAPGTEIAVLLALAEGGIIKLDERKSKVSKIADDKGTNLLAAKPPKESFFSGPLSSFPKFTKDRKACIVEFQAHACPAAGSKEVQVEATIVLSVGQGQEVVKQEKVEAKKGAGFKAGAASFKITEAGKNDFGDDPMKLSLESKDGLKVAKMRFLDAAGKEIESRLGSHGSMSFGADATYSWDYTLKQMVPGMTVEVTLWKKVESIEVPVKLTVSLGL